MARLFDLMCRNWVLFLLSIIVFAAYAAIFWKYFPNAQGGFGHDYEQQFPNLLAGYYWFVENGFFSIPWFIPSQCGGVPLYADPGHGLFSLPQWLAFFVGPIFAVKMTFYVFAVLGYAGFYFLLRRRFAASQPFSLLGAALFLFNGFFAARMLIGHPFHAFMLWPFLFLLFVPEAGSRPLSFFGASSVTRTLLAGAILAYMFHSAMIHVIPAVLLSLAVAILFHAWRFGRERKTWIRFGASGIAALGLIASKLAAAASFLSNFPRSGYSLPGFPNLLEQVGILAQALFLRPPVEQARRLIANSRWTVGEQEMEYGLTFVPLVLLGAAAIFFIAKMRKKQAGAAATRRSAGYLAAMVSLLIIPVALNWYSPGWNAFLKSLPVFESASLLTRWYAAYIPLAIIFSISALSRVGQLRRHAWWIAVLGIAVVFAYQATQDRSSYQAQKYEGDIITEGYRRAKASGRAPPVYAVSMYDPEAKPDPTRGQNDLLVAGLSQMACYNAIFGYRLEWLPLGDLHTGPVFDETSGYFNMKNPACYLYPEENNCAPGDHFLVSQKDDFENFLGYKPYAFKKSALQRAADIVNLLALLFLVGWFAFLGSRRLAKKFF